MLKKMMSIMTALTLLVGATVSPNFAATAVKTATPGNDNLIIVNGIGTIVAKPDVAYLQVGYEARNKEALVAQNEVKVKMANIVKMIKAQGIKDADIKTVTVSLYKTTDYDANNVKNEYFIATNTVEVTVRSIDKVGSLIDIATDAGSNQLGSVMFAVENQEKYQLEAMKLAIKNGGNKANAIASAIGVKIGKPSKITENSYNGGVIYREAATLAKAADSTPVEAGTINIEVTLNMEYKY